MTERNPPISHIIDMARTISTSGQVGPKESKAEAESVVRQLIGGADQVFYARYGVNYWNHLKAMLIDYVGSRGLEGEFVVKGSPFNWHSSIGTKCSAVILRKNFHRGEAHVEPELFIDVGLLTGAGGLPFPGACCGFHYLSSPEGDKSPFIQGVLEDHDLRSTAWALSNNGFINPSLRSNGASSFWDMGASLVKIWGESEIPLDLEKKVYQAFDELMPLYQKVISL